MSMEWPLIFFTLFVGLGCGTFVGAVILTEWRGRATQIRVRSVIIALIALAAGGFSSVLHLGHPERIFAALGHPTSGIFMESTMIGLVGLDIIIYLVALKREASDRTRKVIATIGTIPAVILAFAVGYSYVMPSRPAWDTLILPLFYLVSAGVMGCFTLSVLIGLSKNSNRTVSKTSEAGKAATEAGAAEELSFTAERALKRTALTALALQGVLLIAYLVHLAVAHYPEATRSAARVLTGNLAPVFWLGVVLIGFLVPVVLTVRSRSGKGGESPSITFTSLGLASVLIGGISFRILMFSLGSSIITFF